MHDGRTILHVDMNNCYASIECNLDPSLRGKAVAVGGDVENRHGIILAKNYAAKAFGVSTGEALWQAKQKCPDLVIVPPHYEEYIKYSELAHGIYREYTDLMEPYGLDECWLDVTGSSLVMGSGKKIADEIRNRVKEELGITVSVGVSFNKIFAKLGSDLKKPDAVTVIGEDSFREKVWPLPAEDMLGVGRATSGLLSSWGIHTIGELAAADPRLIQSRLGKNGLALISFANGICPSPVCSENFEPPVKSVGHGLTAREDLENPAEVWNMMLSLSQDIGTRLRKYGKEARGVAIDIRNSELRYRQWQCPLPQKTSSSGVIARAAFELFDRSYSWSLPVRSLTVRAISLCSSSIPTQLSFYSDFRTVERQEKIDTAVDDIRRRFGKYSIMPASLCRDIKMPTDREIQLKMPTGMLTI